MQPSSPRIASQRRRSVGHAHEMWTRFGWCHRHWCCRYRQPCHRYVQSPDMPVLDFTCLARDLRNRCRSIKVATSSAKYSTCTPLLLKGRCDPMPPKPPGIVHPRWSYRAIVHKTFINPASCASRKWTSWMAAASWTSAHQTQLPCIRHLRDALIWASNTEPPKLRHLTVCHIDDPLAENSYCCGCSLDL